MGILKKLLVLACVISTLSISFVSVKAETSIVIADASNGEYDVIEEFDNYSLANNFFNKHKDEYDNLVILVNDEVINMEYGIVKFISDDNNSDINYKSLINGNSSINKNYAADAAYINTSNDLETVTFRLAGDIGNISIDYVELIPYEMINVRVSSYSINDGVLLHNIKTNLNNDYYSYSICIDNQIDFLDEGSLYYSYDGHYFYEDFKLMIDDYRSGAVDNSVNNQNPYYNYYEYLPHRSYTNYNMNEVEDYFNNKLYIDGKLQSYNDLNMDNANDEVNLSQFYNEFNSFFGYEKLYGANAMMMLALSTHESAYGKSLYAFKDNNLFNHAAYDTDFERYASRYDDIDKSVYSHAKYYVSRLYSGVHSPVYHGSFFGDKLSGINVEYSNDPYWGEKVAANYYRFDKALSFKDKDAYALGIINEPYFGIYQDTSLSSLSYKIENIRNYSVIILEELDNAYKIQLDASYSDEYLYDPEVSVGYVYKDIVDFIVNEDKVKENSYRTIHYDFDEGEVIGKNALDIKTLSHIEPSISKPQKDGFEFIGFEADGDNYQAIYREIESIEMYHEFPSEIECGYFYDLKGGKLRVNYKDGSRRIINIDTNMIESYDEESEGESSLTINYCGVTLEYPVNFNSKLSEYRNTLNEYIDNNVSSYKENQTYNQQELDYIKDNLKKVDYQTRFDDIRYLDKMLLDNNRDKVNYHFIDSKYDVSISGLALSLKDPEPISVFKPFKDTYYVSVSDIPLQAKERLSNIAKAYDFYVEDSIKVSVSYNLAKAKFENPIIISVKLQDKKTDKIYTVYHLDDDGNVVKCMTTQSKNYISFMTRSEGDFMILSMDSVNNYDIEDRYENISVYNADPDNHLLFMEGSVLLIFALLGFIMIVIHNIFEKKKEKVWNDYKKSLQEAVLHQEEKQKN